MRDKVIDKITMGFWLQTLQFNTVALPISYKPTRNVNSGSILLSFHILRMYHGKEQEK